MVLLAASTPFGLELASIIISILAFGLGLLAVLPFIQLLWGRPRIELSFVTVPQQNVDGLRCEIINPPIENKLLKRLKIRRSTVEDAMATFSIYRGDTDQGVFLATPHIERYDGNASQRVNIPASGIPSWFGIAVVVDGVVKPGFDIHIGDVLSPGMYRVEVHILAAENEYKWEHRFIVQPHQPFVYWANL